MIFELPDKFRNPEGDRLPTAVKIFGATLEAKGKDFQK